MPACRQDWRPHVLCDGFVSERQAGKSAHKTSGQQGLGDGLIVARFKDAAAGAFAAFYPDLAATIAYAIGGLRAVVPEERV
jgi:hypothetical protein